MQEALNPSRFSPEKSEKGETLYSGRVTKHVFNGDMGRKKAIQKIKNDDDELVDIMKCDFMGETIQYTKDELKELQLAYALNIHKSQGGQAPIVIIPVSTTHYRMLARNLIYTGMTRAEKSWCSSVPKRP